MDPKGKPNTAEDHDGRSRLVSFEKEMGELKVSDKMAKIFSTEVVKIEVYELNKETNEEYLKECIDLDLSKLLYFKEEFKVNFLL